jgi:hypothetical protein
MPQADTQTEQVESPQCGTKQTLDDLLRMAALLVLQVQRKTAGRKPTIAKAAQRLDICC